MTYCLADTTYFIDDLKSRFQLPETPAYREFATLREAKKSSIPPEFHTTPAMKTDSWKGVNFANRPLYTRYAIHVFHNDVCTNETFH